ncbi:UNVERIFIED_CONTAM: hypothetical protein RMT77_003817 [Armadillidium vulgare]
MRDEMKFDGEFGGGGGDSGFTRFRRRLADLSSVVVSPDAAATSPRNERLSLCLRSGFRCRTGASTSLPWTPAG